MSTFSVTVFKSPILSTFHILSELARSVNFKMFIAGFSAITKLNDALQWHIYFAVPKQKVSHARKRKRMATKWLKPSYNIIRCSACGTAKFMHTMCWTCFKRFKIESRLSLSAIKSVK